MRRAAARKAMRDHNISQRRVCRLVGVDPKTVRRDKPPDNPEVREELKAIASKRRRFGYRRIGVLLERQGMIMNHKKLYRLYTEEKLGVRRRRGRKRARGSRTSMPVALRPSERLPGSGWPIPASLRHVRRCPPQTGALAVRLQQRPTALISGQPNTR